MLQCHAEMSHKIANFVENSFTNNLLENIIQRKFNYTHFMVIYVCAQINYDYSAVHR